MSSHRPCWASWAFTSRMLRTFIVHGITLALVVVHLRLDEINVKWQGMACNGVVDVFPLFFCCGHSHAFLPLFLLLYHVLILFAQCHGQWNIIIDAQSIALLTVLAFSLIHLQCGSSGFGIYHLLMGAACQPINLHRRDKWRAQDVCLWHAIVRCCMSINAQRLDDDWRAGRGHTSRIVRLHWSVRRQRQQRRYGTLSIWIICHDEGQWTGAGDCVCGVHAITLTWWRGVGYWSWLRGSLARRLHVSGLIMPTFLAAGAQAFTVTAIRFGSRRAGVTRVIQAFMLGIALLGNIFSPLHICLHAILSCGAAVGWWARLYCGDSGSANQSHIMLNPLSWVMCPSSLIVGGLGLGPRQCLIRMPDSVMKVLDGMTTSLVSVLCFSMHAYSSATFMKLFFGSRLHSKGWPHSWHKQMLCQWKTSAQICTT